MASTDVDVCNLAIGKCSGDRIDALGEESPLGAFCAETYPSVRETMLGAYRWTFNKEVRLFTAVGLVPGEAAVMAYKFAKPADMIGAVHAWRDHIDPEQGASLNVFEANGFFWSDSARVFGEYTAKREEAAWPVWFRDLVVNAFAIDVAHYCQLNSKARDLTTITFGTPSEGGKGGLFAKAMEQDARMAPQRTLSAGVEGGALIEARYAGAPGSFAHLFGFVR